MDYVLISVVLMLELFLIIQVRNVYGYGSTAFISSVILFMCFGIRPLMICADGYVLANYTTVSEKVFYSSFAVSMLCLLAYYGALIINVKNLALNKIQKSTTELSVGNKLIYPILTLFAGIHLVLALRLNDVNQLVNIHEARARADNIIYMGIGFIKELLLLAILISMPRLGGRARIVSILVIAIVISREVLLFASKNTLFTFVFLILLAFRLNQIKIKLNHILIFSVVLFLAFVLSEFSRYVFVSDELIREFRGDISSGIFDLIGVSIKTMLTRFHGFDSISAVIASEGLFSRPFLTFSVFVGSLMPRFINPEKGDVALSVWFGDTFWGSVNTGIAFWPPTEFTLSFGLFSPFAMFMLGIFIKTIERQLFPLNWWRVFVYASFYNSFRLMEYTFATSFTAFIMNFVFSSIFYIFAFRIFMRVGRGG